MLVKRIVTALICSLTFAASSALPVHAEGRAWYPDGATCEQFALATVACEVSTTRGFAHWSCPFPVQKVVVTTGLGSSVYDYGQGVHQGTALIGYQRGDGSRAQITGVNICTSTDSSARIPTPLERNPLTREHVGQPREVPEGKRSEAVRQGVTPTEPAAKPSAPGSTAQAPRPPQPAGATSTPDTPLASQPPSTPSASPGATEGDLFEPTIISRGSRAMIEESAAAQLRRIRELAHTGMGGERHCRR